MECETSKLNEEIKILRSFADYSQLGEERVAINILERIAGKNKITPYYVDIGGYHPILGSNTYKLYQLGWVGTVVEPNDKKTQGWLGIRPKDTVINKAIVPDDYSNKTVFMKSLGDKDARESIVEAGGLDGSGSGKTYECPALKVGSLFQALAENSVQPAFVNIDIEGLESALITGSKFYLNPIPLICIEHFLCEFSDKDSIFEYRNSILVQTLEEAGYVLVSICGVSLMFSHKSYFVPFA